MIARNLVYYTVFGDDAYCDNARLSIDALRRFGNFTGEVLVFSDRPFHYPDVANRVVPLPDSNETVKIRITCYHHFPFSDYDRVLFLDSDILTCRDVSDLLACDDTFMYFPQDDRYCTTGVIDALYFDALT